MGFAEFDSFGTTASTPYYANESRSLTTVRIPVLDLPRDPNVMPRGAQLAEIVRLSTLGRRQVSPREGVRLGWHDAPRRPCYRSVRAR